MSQDQFARSRTLAGSRSAPYGRIAIGPVCLLAVLAGATALTSPLGPALRDLAYRLFALDSVQNATWYLTRASGLTAYLLLWLSTAWGLAIPSRLTDRLLHRSYTFDFHQVISLLALGFLALHVFVLTADRFLPFSLAQILLPFVAPYRPFWVGIGVIAMYIAVLVTATFYLRQRIGLQAFRLIHYTSLIGYLGATVHGIYAGTDSSLPAAMLMYFGTFLVIAFLTIYWLMVAWQGRRLQLAATTERRNPRPDRGPSL